jgi:hypothetical protein
MTVKPDKSYFIDYPPKNGVKDMVDRLKIGIDNATKDGFEYCYIIENDDYYPADYFEKMQFNEHDFIGDPMSVYYHIKTKGYLEAYKPLQPSLFTTGFKISAIKNFRFPNNVFVDIDLWAHARKAKKRFVNSGAIGIKHGVGLCGGKGHSINYRLKDEGSEYLKSKVDSEAFDFYTSIKL